MPGSPKTPKREFLLTQKKVISLFVPEEHKKAFDSILRALRAPKLSTKFDRALENKRNWSEFVAAARATRDVLEKNDPHLDPDSNPHRRFWESVYATFATTWAKVHLVSTLVLLDAFPAPGYFYVFPKGVVMDLTDSLARMNALGFITTHSQLGLKQSDYMERAQVSGYIVGEHRARALEDALNRKGFVAAATKYKHYGYSSEEENFMVVNKLRHKICGSIPITWGGEGEIVGSTGVNYDEIDYLPAVAQTYWASRTIFEDVRNGELFEVTAIDPVIGRFADRPRTGMFSNILKVLTDLE